MKRFFLLLFAFLLITGIIAGCAPEEELTADPENGCYEIYYQGAAYKAVTVIRRAEGDNPEAIAENLFELMQEPDRETDAISVFPENVELWRATVENQVLYLYFTRSYLDMSDTQSVICRAALARTMTQIPGVQFISIYAGNQPLMDENGTPIGNISASDFVHVAGRDINTIQHTSLTLYFADEEGKALVSDSLEVTYSNTASVESFVMERMISGPDKSGMKPVLGDDVKLLGISVRDGVCYVNLSEEFLTPLSEINPEITLYAMVNSLTSLANINQVQFSVEGSKDVSFGNISLSEPFFRNLDYVGSEEGGSD